MNAWSRLNLTLAVVVAVLLTSLLMPEEDADNDRLLDIKRDTITSLRVERSDRLALSFERDDRGWRLLHPEAAPAELQRVEQLIAVTRAAVLQRFAVPDDLQPYGLDAPAAVMQVNQQRLLFGDRDPSQRHRYVLVGDQLCVIDDVYFNLLKLPATHFLPQ